MKKIVFLISAILFLNFCIAAQDRSPTANPNFTGTWIFDAKASQVASDFKRDFKDYTLVIVHAEPEIKITRSAVFRNENISADLILYSDRRGEKNQPYFRVKTQEVASKSFWKKGALVRESTETLLPDVNAQIRTTEKYILSEDKKTLIINGTSNAIGVTVLDETRNYRWVFRKKE
jgi:hypothetical protein